MSAATAPDDDFLVFNDETVDEAGGHKELWKIMLVDDEPEIHTVTKMALADFVYDNKGLEFVSAYSGEEARKVLGEHPDTALILLDVVMERDDAGLQFVKYVRNELGDHQVRIVLRTGQPGMAPERDIVTNYDVDDYKLKTELTVPKLYSTVVASLRGFKEVKRIERVVEERTATIVEMNKTLTTINRDLTDSIQYARRIQEAILPVDALIRTHLPNFFVCYESKDIVSGDFYWFHSRGPVKLIAAVDCTGHGVPGAFMSVLGYSLLNQVVAFLDVLSPDEILTKLDQELHRALARTEREGVGTADGMDIALCSLNTETNELNFAGARRPMLIYRADGSLETYVGTRRSIGGIDAVNYERITTRLNSGDTVVIYTDGITDQFGGDRGRKLSSRAFKEFMGSRHRLPPSALEQALRDFVIEWSGTYPQTDDILVMGIQA